MKTLFIFTNEYPFGQGEMFFEAELDLLCKEMETVYLFPFTSVGIKREIPTNACTVELNENMDRTYLLLIKNIRVILSVILYEILFSPDKHLYIKNSKQYFYTLIGNLRRALALNDFIRTKFENSANVAGYSYWMSDWSNPLALLNSIKPGNFQFICRVHGYDFDEAQQKKGFHLFRAFDLSKVKAVYSVTQFGMNHIISRFPRFKNKLKMSRLGVKAISKNPRKSEEIFVLASCSSLISIKRVNLIVQALAFIEIPIMWVHFGSGQLEADLKTDSSTLPPNVQCVWKGHVDNEEVRKYYEKNHVDLFINVSELEGMPVSIMEAFAAGIPVLAPSITGIPEIVSESNGFLVPKDIKPEDLALTITQIAKDRQGLQNKRSKAFDTWKEFLNSESNYKDFYYSVLIPLVK